MVSFIFLQSILFLLANKIFKHLQSENVTLINPSHKKYGYVVFFVFFVFGIYGKIHIGNDVYPLTENDAYFSSNYKLQNLAKNPVENFITDVMLKKYSQQTEGDNDFSYKKAQKLYPLAANVFNNIDGNLKPLSLRRKNSPENSSKFNIVLVMLESLGSNIMGISGNKLNLTPNLDKLAREGLFFNNAYATNNLTFESIFEVLTGIPDVTFNGATISSKVGKPGSIINQLTGYKKWCFLGGDSSIMSLRKMLHRNIDDLKVFEGFKHSKYQALDAWGISDLSLFKEVDKKLQSFQNETFFAFIQTSSHHLPYADYSIELPNYTAINIEHKEYNKYGFSNLKELNATKLLDSSIGEFIKMARKSSYFDNTLFVFFGDHQREGLNFRDKHIRRGELSANLNKVKIPIIFYSPKLIKKPVHSIDVASLVDVLPTALSLIGESYYNNFFGRNLLEKRNSDDKLAFVKSGNGFGLVSGKYFFKWNKRNGTSSLYDLNFENLLDLSKKKPKVNLRLEQLTHFIYEMSRYLIFHQEETKLYADL